MADSTRRWFLAEVGRGMLVASVGPALAQDLGLARVSAADETRAITFGTFEPLVEAMQTLPPDKLLPLVVEKLHAGMNLRTVVAAAALANARTFGGEDYVGFHSFMALAPAYQMAQELPSERAALPVLKVLYRNTARIQGFGGKPSEVLHPVDAEELPANADGGALLQQAVRSADMNHAERTFAALTKAPEGEAFNHLQFAVQDEVDVHRVVLAWRAWAALDLTDHQYAHDLLRQSVRYCVKAEQQMKEKGRTPSGIRSLLPKLLDEHKLLTISTSGKRAEDAWIDQLSTLIANGAPDQAASAVAAALAEGFAAADVAEAISLAANSLVLRDPGMPAQHASAEKPAGSVHGASVGVHASDSANAWRNIALVSNHRNAMASLIVGAYHTAGQHGRLNKEPYPTAEQLAGIASNDPTKMLAEMREAVEARDQFRACALAGKYGQLGHDARPVFDLLLGYGISEDGALHAEKFYRTASEEFTLTRPAFRWRHLMALARVTASEFGHPAPGYAQARELLKV